MLLNLDFRFKDLAGEEITTGLNVAKTLAEVLGRKAGAIPPIKAVDWALKLYNKGEIEIDREDSKLLENAVNEVSELTNVGKSAIILAIQSLKEAPKEV